MKLSRISLWSLTLAGCLPAVRAESWNQFPESGPETTLDSMWASAAYVQTLVEASSARINISRFRQKGPSNLWAGALGSFGDVGVRNNQPSFDYSAAGYALGYDYGTYGEKSGSLLGLAFGQMFGHQNIQEMPDYPDGPMEGDRFRQSAWMANLYGAFFRETGPRSSLLLAANAAFGSTENKCRHSDAWGNASRWDSETFQAGLSASWRYQVTNSFSVIPFMGVTYVHGANKVKRDDRGGYGDSSWWGDYWWDDDDWGDDDDYNQRWDNRGTFDNVSMAMGVTLEHVLRLSGNTIWINALSGSYCPDICRNDPHYTFRDGWWEGDEYRESRYKGKGYSPGKQSFKVKLLSRMVFNDRCSVFASYQAHFRESFLEHQAALGVSVSF